MNWTNLWMTIFKTTTFCGLNMGFWVAIAAVMLIVIVMNVVFWSMKPQKKDCGTAPEEGWTPQAAMKYPST